MTDWAYRIEDRNYGIKKKPGISARELLWALFLLVPIMGTLIFCVWVRSQITHTGYKIQELSKREESLAQTQVKLIVKEGKLQSSERIDRVARARLGMAPMRPDQVLAPRIPNVPVDRSVMAMSSN